MTIFARFTLHARAATRAGKLVWGPNNTNFCPAGSYVITDLTQCQSAAATAGKGWGGSVGSYSEYPRGCYGSTAGYVNLNTDPTGGANPGTQPLCAVGTGPLSRTRTRKDGHTRERAHANAAAPTRVPTPPTPSPTPSPTTMPTTYDMAGTA